MSAFYLLLAEVPQNKAEVVSDSAVKAGSFGGTVLRGKSVSSSGLADALGLGAKTKELVLILVEQNNMEKIFSAIQKACENERRNFGCLYALESDTMVKGGVIKGKEGSGMTEEKQTLISVILNKGYADDAMAAARKAGAGGGTVINARGTAREDDAKFFGMHIVPEKEMLVIVVDSEKKDAVLEAVKNLQCLQEPGSGIIFCSSVASFSTLGKK
ncbi:P-II family nitrogen regulator [Treponema sp.]|uniref:P-II family nitrogen regulator n=1 Tax=Treponema sp. TaxID=166 RepID=UPI003F053126